MAETIIGLPSAPPPVDTQIDRCLTCGAPLTYSGRGRRPKYCTEHNPKASASPRTRRTSASMTYDDLEEGIAATLTTIGMLATFVDPFDANVFILRSEKVAKHWRNAAEKNPAIRRILERMLSLSALGEFTAGAGLLIVPILAHHGVIPIPEMIVAPEVRTFTDSQKPEIIRHMRRATPPEGSSVA